MTRQLLFGFLTPEGAGPQYWNVIFHSYLRKELERVMLAHRILLTPAQVLDLFGRSHEVQERIPGSGAWDMEAFIASMTCAKIQPFFAFGEYDASLSLVQRVRSDLVAPSPAPSLLHIASPEEAFRKCALLGLGEAHFRYATILAERAHAEDEGPPLFQDRKLAERTSPLVAAQPLPSA